VENEIRRPQAKLKGQSSKEAPDSKFQKVVRSLARTTGVGEDGLELSLGPSFEL
jgi:hypothetical protein